MNPGGTRATAYTARQRAPSRVPSRAWGQGGSAELAVRELSAPDLLPLSLLPFRLPLFA